MSKKLLQLIYVLCMVVQFPSGLSASEEYVKQMHDEESDFDFEYEEGPAWKEDKLGNLTPPQDDNLKLLDIDHAPVGFEVYIDTTSISVSEKDRIVRYWLVLKAGKSRNTMYEGMKCNNKHYKTYAYENKWNKGKVNISKVAKWLPIKKEGHDFFRFELWRYYFCSEVLPRPVEDILDIIAGYKSTTSDYDPTYYHDQ